MDCASWHRAVRPSAEISAMRIMKVPVKSSTAGWSDRCRTSACGQQSRPHQAGKPRHTSRRPQRSATRVDGLTAVQRHTAERERAKSGGQWPNAGRKTKWHGQPSLVHGTTRPPARYASRRSPARITPRVQCAKPARLLGVIDDRLTPTSCRVLAPVGESGAGHSGSP